MFYFEMSTIDDVQELLPEVAFRAKRSLKSSEDVSEPMEDILLRRITTIKEGDNVLLRLPSDAIKAVVASKDG